MDSLLELFCDVDDFCKEFLTILQKTLLENGLIQRQREKSLSMSEVMTILIAFHQSPYRNFKTYYCQHVLTAWRSEFPHLVSYSRFVEFIPLALMPLSVFLKQTGMGACSGISSIDSTSLAVCHNARIHQNKAFTGTAQRGHTSTGWFCCDFKLHLVVNGRGDLLNVLLTPGDVDDRKPVPYLVQELFGKLFGDYGYLSTSLAEKLREAFQVQVITKLREKLKNKLLLFADALILRKRSIIETIIDQLKNISQIEHSRHRSVTNFVVNVLCGLIAYSRRPKKPSLGFSQLACLPGYPEFMLNLNIVGEYA